MEGTDKKGRIHPRCKRLSSHSLTKELEGTFQPRINHLCMTDFDSPETVWKDILFLSFQCRSQPSEAWKFSVSNSLEKITAFSWIMEADNCTFWLHVFRNQLKIVWSTSSWLPDFNFYLLTLVPFFNASESFSLFLTQVNKVFLGTLYLAATSLSLSPFSKSLSAWHFSRSVWRCILVFLPPTF